jgi:hypothetical protein
MDSCVRSMGTRTHPNKALLMHFPNATPHFAIFINYPAHLNMKMI